MKQQEKQFKELGEYLAQRHRHNFRRQARESRAASANSAIHFGRYLRAARTNAGLSQAALAKRSGVSAVTLLALEQGIIVPQDIKAKWLNQLADALDENIDEFRLLLGDHLNQNSPKENWIARLPRLFQPGSGLRPVYGAISAILLCVLLSMGLLGHLSHFTPPPSASQTTSALVIVKPELRQNLIKAEMRLQQPLTILPRLLPALVDIPAAARLNIIEAERHLAHSYEPPAPLLDRPRLPLLPTLINIDSASRLNMINAEFRFENQVYILKTLIKINPENRLNMIKAEHRL